MSGEVRGEKRLWMLVRSAGNITIQQLTVLQEPAYFRNYNKLLKAVNMSGIEANRFWGGQQKRNLASELMASRWCVV